MKSMETKLQDQYKELDEMVDDLFDEVNEIKTGKENIKFDVTTRKLKNRTKYTLTANLKVGKKTYKVKQVNEIFDPSYYRVDEDDPYKLRDWWYMTTAQMKSILKNNPVWIKHKSTFDGMIDGTQTLHGDYCKPSKHWLNRIIEQLSRRGLFRIHFNQEKSTFSLFSCVDNYEVYVEGVEFK